MSVNRINENLEGMWAHVLRIKDQLESSCIALTGMMPPPKNQSPEASPEQAFGFLPLVAQKQRETADVLFRIEELSNYLMETIEPKSGKPSAGLKAVMPSPRLDMAQVERDIRSTL